MLAAFYLIRKKISLQLLRYFFVLFVLEGRKRKGHPKANEKASERVIGSTTHVVEVNPITRSLAFQVFIYFITHFCAICSFTK